MLEPVESRVDASDVFQQDDFYEEALDAFRFGGTLTCLPQNISSLVVYYNKDLFLSAGVPDPRTGWNWNEMVLAAKKLTKDENGDGLAEVYGLGVEASLIRIAPFVWSNGGELVDDEDNPTHFTLDSPEAQVALSEFFRLRLAYGVVPSDEEVEAEDDETRFQNGRIAMVLSSRRSTPTFRTITDFDWDVAALPQFNQQAGILHSDAYCMTKASENKDAAWSFMEYALGPEGAAGGRQVRTHRSVPEGSRGVRRVPRSDGEAGELAGLPRHDPGHPPGTEHLDLAGDRGRCRSRSWRRPCTKANQQRKSPRGSERQRIRSSSGLRASWQR